MFSGLSSCFVGVFCCCACCQPTEVTKDCRVLPAPSVHTHTPASTIPAVHCNVAAKGFSFGIQNKLTHRVGQLVTIQSEKETHADFAAHGRPGIAPVLLAAVQPGPWLRPAISLSLRTRQTCQRHGETKTLGKHLNSSAGIFSAWRL